MQVFLAGGVPEVMLELRAAGLLDYERDALSAGIRSIRASTGGATASGGTLCGERLKELDGIDADDVIMTPDRARAARPHGDNLLSRRKSCA